MPSATLSVTPPPVAVRKSTRKVWMRESLRVLLFLALIIVPAGLVVHYISLYAVDVPYWDEWENALFFTVSRYGHQSIVELARQQNESRLLIPNLVSLVLSLPGNWSVVREMYFNVGLVAAICFTLFQLLRRTGFSLPTQSALLFVIGWLMFSLAQHENWFFGIQLCYFIIPFTLCLALLANVTRWQLGTKTLVALALAFVALYSFSGGVLVSALAFPGWLPANWSAAGRWRPSRRELAWHVVYFVGSLLMLVTYFWHYTQPGGRGSLLDMLLHSGSPFVYFFAWLGSPLFPHEPISQAVTTGIAAFVLLGGLLVTCGWRMGSRVEQRRLYPWIMLAGYAIGTGAITVIGRGGYGVHQALSSRYISFSLYAYVVILVLGAYLWCFHRRRVKALPRVILLVAGLATLAASGTVLTRGQVRSVPYIIDNNHLRNFAQLGLTFLPVMPTSQNIDALCGVPEYVQIRAMDLLRRRVLNVPLVSFSLRASLHPVAPNEKRSYGELDPPDMDADSHVSLRGWAVDPVKQQPAGKVLITVTPKDGTAQPLVAFCTDLSRPDAAPADGKYQKMDCAFMGLADFDRLAPGDYLVAAWQVDLQANKANQLAGAYNFHWARPGTVMRPLNEFVFPPLDPSQETINGSLDTVELRKGDTLDVFGWATNVTHAVPPKTVLITCTDAAGATRVVGHAEPGLEYKSIADLYRNDSLRYSGFRSSINLGKLPPGAYQVGAWAVGDVDDGETIAQLGGTYRIQIHP